jgi:hypothetical protein
MAVSDVPAERAPRAFIEETCVVERWQGYVSSSFYAALADGTTLADSTSFRCRGVVPKDSAEARAAYDEVVSALEAAGWEREDGAADPWYATRFRRSVEVAAPPAHEEVTARELEEDLPAQLLRALPTREPDPEPRPEPAVEVSLKQLPPDAGPPAERAANAPAAWSRSKRMAVAIGVLSGVSMSVGAIFFGAEALRGPHHHAAPAVVPVKTLSTGAATGRVTPTASRGGAAATVRLSVTATGHATWLEVRRGSATGAVLFTGELQQGDHRRFRAPRLWARFGSAGNLAIRLDGKPVSLRGTTDHVFTASSK